MSRDGIVLDTALFVSMIVVLSLVTLLGSEVAEVAGWQQSTIDGFELGIEGVMMLLFFAFTYRVQNELRETLESLSSVRAAAALNTVLVIPFVYALWYPAIQEPLLSVYFVFAVLLLYNALYPLFVPYLIPRISRLIVRLNKHADTNVEVSDK